METVTIDIQLPKEMKSSTPVVKTIETSPSFYNHAISMESRPTGKRAGEKFISIGEWKSMKNKAKVAYHVRALVSDELGIKNPHSSKYSYKIHR